MKKRPLSSKHLLLVENVVDLLAAVVFWLWVLLKDALQLSLSEKTLEILMATGASMRLMLRKTLQLVFEIVNDGGNGEGSGTNSQPPSVPVLRETKDDLPPSA